MQGKAIDASIGYGLLIHRYHSYIWDIEWWLREE